MGERAHIWCGNFGQYNDDRQSDTKTVGSSYTVFFSYHVRIIAFIVMLFFSSFIEKNEKNMFVSRMEWKLW